MTMEKLLMIVENYDIIYSYHGHIISTSSCPSSFDLLKLGRFPFIPTFSNIILSGRSDRGLMANVLQMLQKRNLLAFIIRGRITNFTLLRNSVVRTVSYLSENNMLLESLSPCCLFMK